MKTETQIVRGQIKTFDIDKCQMKVNCSFKDIGVEVTQREGITLVTVFKDPEAGSGF